VTSWVLSLGKRPVVRALPATREVRVAKHLHAAERKVAECTLPSTGDAQRLAAAVRDMVVRGDTNVRVVLRPKIAAALDQVALHPHNLPERVAEKKLVDELLDQAVAVGRLSIGNLRDAISHNDLKMPDLALRRLGTGDELLRCDLALSQSLDGVYRRGEGYLRFLQKISSVFFGTAIGRLLTLYLILPLLGSFTVFKGAQEMIDLVAGTRTTRGELATRLVSPDAESLAADRSGREQAHHGPGSRPDHDLSGAVSCSSCSTHRRSAVGSCSCCGCSAAACGSSCSTRPARSCAVRWYASCSGAGSPAG
jgi:hypothetical protein